MKCLKKEVLLKLQTVDYCLLGKRGSDVFFNNKGRENKQELLIYPCRMPWLGVG